VNLMDFCSPLTQHKASPGGKGAKTRPGAVASNDARTSAGFAVYGHLFGAQCGQLTRHPAPGGVFKLPRINLPEDAPEGGRRADPVFQPQIPAQPIQLLLRP